MLVNFLNNYYNRFHSFRFSIDLHDHTNILTKLIVGEKPSDSPWDSAWDVYFLKPASPLMYGLIDLHNFIMVYLVFIVFFVIFMLTIILNESTIVLNNEIKKFFQIKRLYNVRFDHHTVLETIWIVVPSLILLSIAVPSFTLLYAMDIIPEHDFSIKVIGHQWYWSYEYLMNNLLFYNIKKPRSMLYSEVEFLHRYTFDSYMIATDELRFDHQIRLLDTTNPLVVPVGKYASLTITSTDVIHAFAVPALGIKVDAVPGRLNTVALYITEVGHYYGQCSELCGVNHGFMPIEIYCVDMVSFTIYKAALASKIVTKDLTVMEIDIAEKQHWIRRYFMNFYYGGSKNHLIYFKRVNDYIFLNKVQIAANMDNNRLKQNVLSNMINK
jgi:heme/copper-type cytochrome/quinol oxidase subunit 2